MRSFVHQKKRIRVLNAYRAVLGLAPKHVKGFCAGDALLWGIRFLQGSQALKHHEAILTQIANIDENELPEWVQGYQQHLKLEKSQKLNSKHKKKFDLILTLIRLNEQISYLQAPSQVFKHQNQLDWSFITSFCLSDQHCLNQEFTLSFLFSKKELEYTIRYCLFKNRIMRIDGLGHTMVLGYDGDQYVYYDPSAPFGSESFSDTELENLVLKIRRSALKICDDRHKFNAKDLIPLGLTTFGLDQDPSSENIYPDKQKLLEKLINQKATNTQKCKKDIEGLTVAGMNFFNFAALRNDNEAMAFFLDKNVDVCAPLQYSLQGQKRTVFPVLAMIIYNNKKGFDLIKKKALPTHRDKIAALKVACQFGKKGIIEDLVQMNTDPFKKTKTTQCPTIYIAAQSCDFSYLSQWIKWPNRFNPDVESKRHIAALIYQAIKGGNLSLLEDLVEYGYCNFKEYWIGSEGCPLEEAIRCDQPEILNYLLTLDGLCTLTYEKKMTLFLKSAAHNRVECILTLFENKISCDNVFDLLSCATKHNYFPIINVLLRLSILHPEFCLTHIVSFGKPELFKQCLKYFFNEMNSILLRKFSHYIKLAIVNNNPQMLKTLLEIDSKKGGKVIQSLLKSTFFIKSLSVLKIALSTVDTVNDVQKIQICTGLFKQYSVSKNFEILNYLADYVPNYCQIKILGFNSKVISDDMITQFIKNGFAKMLKYVAHNAPEYDMKNEKNIKIAAKHKQMAVLSYLLDNNQNVSLKDLFVNHPGLLGASIAVSTHKLTRKLLICSEKLSQNGSFKAFALKQRKLAAQYAVDHLSLSELQSLNAKGLNIKTAMGVKMPIEILHFITHACNKHGFFKKEALSHISWLCEKDDVEKFSTVFKEFKEKIVLDLNFKRLWQCIITQNAFKIAQYLVENQLIRFDVQRRDVWDVLNLQNEEKNSLWIGFFQRLNCSFKPNSMFNVDLPGVGESIEQHALSKHKENEGQHRNFFHGKGFSCTLF